jgi:secondary thiamine-phosphate synthase enzyme
MFTIKMRTNMKNELIDITAKVSQLAREHGGSRSACLVFIPHTTAAVTVNENADPDVKTDIIQGLNRLVPDHLDFKHREGNSDAHIKASLLGASEIIPLQEGRLILGTWQGIYLAEFDGPRSRNVLISFF